MTALMRRHDRRLRPVMLPHSMAARRNFMRKREELVKDRQLALDKAKGSLCGLAIGDSFGDAARKPDFQRDYGITTDFQKGASWSTDDTEFALLTAYNLIRHGGTFPTAARRSEAALSGSSVRETRRGRPIWRRRTPASAITGRESGEPRRLRLRFPWPW